MKKILFYVLTVVLIASCVGNSNSSSNYQRRNMVLKTITERCTDCDGDGYVSYNCNECDGTGYTYLYCSHCGGWGKRMYRLETQEKIICSTCGGSGQVRGSGNVECQSCGGSGHRTCIICKGRGMTDILGDWTVCPRCDGSRIEKCYSCNGHGYWRGSEYETCEDCWGSGASGYRPVVREGYEICEHCHGNSKTRVYCNTCNGNRYIKSYCDTCNGTGKVSVEKWVEE